jgi:hypothetical protein
MQLTLHMDLPYHYRYICLNVSEYIFNCNIFLFPFVQYLVWTMDLMHTSQVLNHLNPQALVL